MSTVILSELSWRDRFRRGALLGLAALAEMPFLEHLEELRGRLIKSLIGIAAGTIAGFIYTAQIIEFLPNTSNSFPHSVESSDERLSPSRVRA